MVNEHFPKVFAFDVNELGNAEGPIKTKLYHVVVPNVPIYGMVRIVVPAIFDVPQPWFVPKDEHTVKEDSGVVETAPAAMKGCVILPSKVPESK